MPVLGRQVLPGCLKLGSGSHTGEEVPPVSFTCYWCFYNTRGLWEPSVSPLRNITAPTKNVPIFLVREFLEQRKAFRTFSDYAVLKSMVFDFNSFSN